MVRTIFLTILLLSLIAGSMACSGDNEESPNSSETPAPASTESALHPTPRLNLSLSHGQRYTFFEDDKEFGFNEYMVTDVSEQNDNTVYTVKSTLHIEPTSACKPTEAAGTLQITQTGSPIAYHVDASIGSG